MAWIRTRNRRDGSSYHSVLFTIDGRQTSVTPKTIEEAEAFCAAVNKLGPRRAMEIYDVPETAAARRGRPDGMTVRQFLEHHIEHLTGVTKATIYDYESYLKNDIGPIIGDIPLTQLSHDDISLWVQHLVKPDANGKTPSGKTLRNKHGFLSGALAAAVRKRRIEFNPAAGTRLPDGERPDMVFLTRDDFNRLIEAATERWRPLMEFLVISGARYGEVAALRPTDIDRGRGIVRIRRAWKRTYTVGGYELGPPKTKRSRRDISMPGSILDKLDYTGDWVFTTTGQGHRWPAGGAVMVSNFRANGWTPAVKKAGIEPRPRIHDLRHTCASWLIADGTPLPVIQRRLGHESIQTTVDVYGHLDRSDDAAAAERLGGAIDSG